MRIILTLDPVDFPDATTPREVQHTLLDALAEFVAHRGPTSEAYVDRRYPNGPDYAWLNRADKIAQVNRRKKIADLLRFNVWATFEPDTK